MSDHSTKRIMPAGKNSASFKGGTVIDKDGYVRVRGAGRFRLQHRLVAEAALGRSLRRGEVVHHINGIRTDNRRENLLICTDAYHRLIHAREDALNATGSPDSRKCIYCGTYDAPSAMTLNTQGKHYHRACAAAYQRNRKAKRSP
ncbi:HNH endonuclease signature motif containing protein [Burkholderia gladioli]|uniref:HNH endonuclease signature motif containing protein n=1 Tax=Burkholderia gladioli TaxID=28095 RepID=UPI003F791B1A